MKKTANTHIEIVIPKLKEISKYKSELLIII